MGNEIVKYVVLVFKLIEANVCRGEGKIQYKQFGFFHLCVFQRVNGCLAEAEMNAIVCVCVCVCVRKRERESAPVCTHTGEARSKKRRGMHKSISNFRIKWCDVYDLDIHIRNKSLTIGPHVSK